MATLATHPTQVNEQAEYEQGFRIEDFTSVLKDLSRALHADEPAAGARKQELREQGSKRCVSAAS